MSSTSKTIVLKSSDGETFEVDEVVALEMQTIKPLIEDNCPDDVIPLPNVTGKILAKVIEYCKRHVDAPKSDDKISEDELKNSEPKFGKADQAPLLDLLWSLPSEILEKVLKYKNYDELKNFDAEFVKVDQDTLFDLLWV